MIHPPCAIDPSVTLRAGVVVWPFSTILNGTVLGEGVVVGSNCWIGKDCTIGARSRLQTGVFVPNGTIIETDVFVGPGVMMTDDKYPRVGNARYHAQPPIIRKGASIGAGAVILPGVEIGEGAMIAAGAVVTRSVEPGMTVIGLPARGNVA